MVRVIDFIVEHFHFGHLVLDVSLHVIRKYPEHRQHTQRFVDAFVFDGDGANGVRQRFSATTEWRIGNHTAFFIGLLLKKVEEFRFGLGTGKEVMIEHVVVPIFGGIVECTETSIEIQQNTFDFQFCLMAFEVFVEPRCSNAHDFAA